MTPNPVPLEFFSLFFPPQGDPAAAVPLYREAAEAWQGATVVLYSLANALLEAGQPNEVGGEDMRRCRQEGGGDSGGIDLIPPLPLRCPICTRGGRRLPLTPVPPLPPGVQGIVRGRAAGCRHEGVAVCAGAEGPCGQDQRGRGGG